MAHDQADTSTTTPPAASAECSAGPHAHDRFLFSEVIGASVFNSWAQLSEAAHSSPTPPRSRPPQSRSVTVRSAKSTPSLLSLRDRRRNLRRTQLHHRRDRAFDPNRYVRSQGRLGA